MRLFVPFTLTFSIVVSTGMIVGQATAQEQIGGCGECSSCCGDGCCDGCCEPWIVQRESLFDHSYLDRLTDLGNFERGRFKLPITGGAWHWFHQSLIGRGGGYGIPGLRGTYYWYLYADPEYDLGGGRKIGSHTEIRLREDGLYREFIAEQVWPYETYGYIHDDNYGTLKAGLVFKQFGIFWDGAFFGTTQEFDGLTLDADYGLSWESTVEVNDCFKIDRYVQFFFREDASNGSFEGGDAESVPGYTERNTGVVRFVPTWTLGSGAVVELGVSGLVGGITSDRVDLDDETVSAYSVDLTYTRGPWKVFGQGAQTFGVINPQRYVSGGPSDRLTNILAGVQYTRGAVTYRCSYSNSIDENPDAIQHMVVTGATVRLSKNVDLYLEYVAEQVTDAEIAGQNGFFFHGLDYTINWHF